MAQENKSLREIASELGIGKSTVSAILRNLKTQSVPIIIEDKIPEPSIMNDSEASDFINSLVGAPESKSVSFGSAGDKKLPDDILASFMSDAPAGLEVAPKKRGSKKQAVSSSAIDALFAPTPSALKSIDATLDKGTLISKITMNVQNFEVVLKDLIKGDADSFLKSLHSKSVSELESTLKMFEHTRSSNNMANQLKYGVFATASAIEGLTKKVLKLKSDGYADLIRAQEAEINAILREMAMDESMNALKQYQTPSVRLATLMATTLLAVDTKNRMSGVNVLQPISKPIDTEKYANL